MSEFVNLTVVKQSRDAHCCSGVHGVAVNLSYKYADVNKYFRSFRTYFVIIYKLKLCVLRCLRVQTT